MWRRWLAAEGGRVWRPGRLRQGSGGWSASSTASQGRRRQFASTSSSGPPPPRPLRPTAGIRRVTSPRRHDGGLLEYEGGPYDQGRGEHGTYEEGRGGFGGGGPRWGRDSWAGRVGTGILALGVGGYVLYRVMWGLAYLKFGDEAPFTHRRRLLFGDAESDRQMGEQMKRQFLKEYRVLPKNHLYAQHVRAVGLNLAREVDKVRASMAVAKGQPPPPPFDWEFFVLDAPQSVNAMVAPGGKVFVHSGMLAFLSKPSGGYFRASPPILPYNELTYVVDRDELAAVVAHEAGHAIARHGSERMAYSIISAIVTFILAQVLESYDLSAMITHLTMTLASSREHEREADIIGLELMAAACYDPRAASDVFARIGQLESRQGLDKVPEFLRTHPLSERRSQDLKQRESKAIDEWIGHGCGRRRRSLQVALEDYRARSTTTSFP